MTLKRIKTSVHPYEASIGRYLSSEPLAKDPRNHSCPIYEVLQVPDDDDLTILVMPLLRRYNYPSFTSTGEIMECLRQFVEVRVSHVAHVAGRLCSDTQGLQFMHSYHIAHR